MSAPTVLDLFAGAVGGWSLGLHRAGYRTVAAAELDPWRRAMFAGEFPGVEMFDDVRAVTAESLRARCGSLPAVVVGSPPCQDASVANHAGKGIDGARTGLFSEWLRIVRECRPVWCCAENVPGLARRGLERIVAELEDAGYRADVLDIGAQDVGAPHRRRRLWIIGTRRDVADAAVGTWTAPAPRIESDRGAREEVEVLGRDDPCRPAPDSDPPALRQQPRRQRGPGWTADATEPRNHGQAGPAPDAGERRCQPDGRAPAGSSRGPDARGDDAVGSGPWAFPGTDTDEARLEIDQGQPGYHGAQRPALVGVDWLDAWASWHGGCAGHLELAHGTESRLARPLVAAIGDAVMPQITEAIGRTMMQLTGGRA